MDGSLQQEYLYSLLNIAHAYFLLHCRGNSEVLRSKHVKDKSVWREYSNSIINM